MRISGGCERRRAYEFEAACLPVKQGDIVWALRADPRGANEKRTGLFRREVGPRQRLAQEHGVHVGT